ncbi:MAG: sodium/proline symporter [Defluviitaleaceae bacterium]|nr:sodium/proline symporter [Defluviitaleaceae bacterium]
MVVMGEVIVFIVYFVLLLVFGIYCFMKVKGGDKEYFLGSRQLGAWVSALSAGASDMSAWVLMGLPAAIFTFGMSRVWIAIGLAIGYMLSWIFIAPRLRRFSIGYDDSITLPQYFTNRFLSKSKALQVVCAVIFLLAYTAYASVNIRAGGILFDTLFGMERVFGMYIVAGFVVIYTFLGGFKAVAWSDFFQGLMMLGALMAAPLFALLVIDPGALSAEFFPDGYWNMMASGNADWASISHILTGFGWGLGYFGMPHIIIRYMSIRSHAEVKKSAAISISWNVLILTFSVLVGIMALAYTRQQGIVIDDAQQVFIVMSRALFPAVISGILLSAIISAAMSSADAKLLVSSSAFTADVYKPIFRKNASDRETIWVGRVVVLVVAFASTIIASNPNLGTIMDLVGHAWGVFGAAFGPTVILSLYWKRFNFSGALAAIIVGTVVNVSWIVLGNVTDIAAFNLFAIVPGFFAGLATAIIVTLATKKPSAEVDALFDAAVLDTESV